MTYKIISNGESVQAESKGFKTDHFGESNPPKKAAGDFSFEEAVSVFSLKWASPFTPSRTMGY